MALMYNAGTVKVTAMRLSLGSSADRDAGDLSPVSPTSSSMSEKPVLWGQLSGWLHKQPLSDKGGKWQRRFFVIRDGFLLYYTTVPATAKFDGHPKGCIALGNSSVTEIETEGKKQLHCFELSGVDHGGFVLRLSAPSATSMHAWMKQLRAASLITYEENVSKGSAWRRSATALDKTLEQHRTAEQTLSSIKADMNTLRDENAELLKQLQTVRAARASLAGEKRHKFISEKAALLEAQNKVLLLGGRVDEKSSVSDAKKTDEITELTVLQAKLAYMEGKLAELSRRDVTTNATPVIPGIEAGSSARSISEIKLDKVHEAVERLDREHGITPEHARKRHMTVSTDIVIKLDAAVTLIRRLRADKIQLMEMTETLKQSLSLYEIAVAGHRDAQRELQEVTGVSREECRRLRGEKAGLLLQIEDIKECVYAEQAKSLGGVKKLRASEERVEMLEQSNARLQRGLAIVEEVLNNMTSIAKGNERGEMSMFLSRSSEVRKLREILSDVGRKGAAPMHKRKLSETLMLQVESIDEDDGATLTPSSSVSKGLKLRRESLVAIAAARGADEDLQRRIDAFKSPPRTPTTPDSARNFKAEIGGKFSPAAALGPPLPVSGGPVNRFKNKAGSESSLLSRKRSTTDGK